MNIPGATAAIKAYREASNNNVVPEATVLHRATICKRCPKRKLTRGVSRVSQILGILSGKHKVPQEISGYSCSVCGCNMLLLLPALPENVHQDSEEESKQRPDACWVKQLKKD